METHAHRLRSHSTVHHPHEREITTKLQPEANEEALVTREVELGEGQADARKASWQWDIRTDITTWSEQLYRILGRDPKTGVPSLKEHSCFYTSDSWEQLTIATLRVLQTGEPYELELHMLRPDGSQRRVIASGEAVRDTSGNILRLCGTVEDITEHELPIVRGERELESLRNVNYGIGRLIRAQEEEHARIAQELRDNICQKLCLLTLEIQGLTPDFPELPPPARVRLEELGLYTTEIVTEIVQFSHRLHPSTLDLLGLPPAIQGLCREFARRNSIPVECSCTDVVPEKIEKNVALSFFRILQEALGNVAKHSYASNVSVELISSSKELLLRVADDGVGLGLDPPKTKVATGLGFICMEELVRSMGGELAVWSTPTGGTRIEARAPLGESLQ